MTWVKLDDLFPEHPKVIGLSNRAFRVLVSGLCYANRYATDGILSLSAQKTIGSSPKIATELVRSGLWELHELGFFIHDYHDFQPRRQDVLAQKEAKSRAGKEGARVTNMKRWSAERRQAADGVPSA